MILRNKISVLVLSIALVFGISLPAQATTSSQFGNTYCSGTRVGYVYSSVSSRHSVGVGIPGASENQLHWSTYPTGGTHNTYGWTQSIGWGVIALNGGNVISAWGSCA